MLKGLIVDVGVGVEVMGRAGRIGMAVIALVLVALAASPARGDVPEPLASGVPVTGPPTLGDLSVIPSVRALGGGAAFACVVTARGGVECWGQNDAGQLGDGTTTNRIGPAPVLGLDSGVAAVSASGNSACALMVAGSVRCWGSNYNGQVGDGTRVDRLAPVDVVGLGSGVAQISVGVDSNCALLIGGAVECWGANPVGNIGDGTSGNLRLTPTPVVGLSSGMVALSPSGGFVDHCALTARGGVKCWGLNRHGQLGDGTTTDRSTPVDVVGLTSGVQAIALGWEESCAITSGGGALCWGWNANGQLGNGTNRDSAVPVPVSGLASGVATLSSGADSHRCAVTDAGGVKCWGYNFAGELGDGTTRTRVSPVAVTGLGSGVTTVVTGQYFSCAVLSTGAVRCWGDNSSGQLGDGTTVNRLTPADIAGSFYRPECPTVVASIHTRFGLSAGYGIGSSATFVPDPGYVLVGTPVATCQTDQTWSSAPPTAVVPPTPPTVLPASASVREGDMDSTAVLIPVTLSTVSAVPVTVAWQTIHVPDAPGTQADPATDYVPTSGAVTFNPGETAKTVAVQVYGDTLVEPDEYIVVSFHDPTDAVMGGYWGLGFGVITNDD